jgi:hypothetical protein
VKVPVLHNVKKNKNTLQPGEPGSIAVPFQVLFSGNYIILKKCRSFKENYLPWGGFENFATLR